MTSMYGLGQSTVSRTSSTEKTEAKGKTEEAGRRPPPPPKYDSCSFSEEAMATMSLSCEESQECQETILDYMDEDLDYDALGISEEDMDFSEMDAFEDIDYVSDEELDQLEESEELDTDLDIDEDVEIEEDGEVQEDAEVTEDTDVTSSETMERVHGYASSISGEDWEMLQIAYQANQMLIWEGSSLFDYLDSSTSTNWFDTDWTSTNTSSFDWDSLLASLTAGSTTTEDTEDTDEVEDVDSVDEIDEVDEIDDSEVISDTAVEEEITADQVYADTF